MAGAFTRRAHLYAAATPSATPLQYIAPGFDGQTIYVNESATTDKQYVAPVGYVNESNT